MTLKNFISFSILFVISLSTWSILRTEHNPPLIQQANADQADTSMENVNANIYNKEGKLALKIISANMTHYPKDDLTKIETPKITVFKKPDNIWNIDANYAEALNGLDEIIFHDNVIVHHRDDPNHPITTLYTSILTVFPEKQIAKTSEAVSIIQPSAKIYAIGMLANMNEGTVKFLSQAREEYAPNS